jgi:hypothetical protein
MKTKPEAIPPRTEGGREFSAEDVGNAVEVIRSVTARMMTGEPRVAPLALHESMQGATVQPAIEAIIVNRERTKYALHKRPPDEKNFGPNRLHILGGFLKPNRHGVSMTETAREMAQKEMGLQDIEFVAGPIAVYQWTRGIEHPIGWPNSQVYVFEAVGEIPNRDDTVWFNIDELPTEDQSMVGFAGKLHTDFLRVFQEWAKSPAQPCRDLKEMPLPPLNADAT